MPNADTKNAETRSIGRGVVWITLAKGYFVFSGLLLITLLPRLIGRTEEEQALLYGSYNVVISVLNPITMMMITGTIQAVSKFISEDPARFGRVKQQALRLQSVFGGLVALLFFALSGVIADLLNDASLTPYLRVSSIIIFCYANYAALIGTFNGRKMFFHQAAMDTLFATLKVGLILGLAYLGFGVMGTVAGFAATATIMLVLALVLSGRGKAEGEISWRDLLRFEVWIMIFALCSNLLMNADLLLLKALGPGGEAVGVYAAALQMSRLPYIAVISVTFVIFPLVSRSTYEADRETTQSYIHITTRYTLILVSLLAVSLSACAPELLRLIFPPIFEKGWPALAILPLAYVAYSFLMIFSAIITGAGAPKVSVGVTLFSLALLLPLSAAASKYLVPDYGPGALAAAVLVSMGAGVVAASAYLQRRFGARFPFGLLAKLTAISAAIYGLSALWSPVGAIFILLKGALVFGLFCALLVLLRVVGSAELARIKAITGRG